MIIKEVRFIDLFAGMGGTRIGFEDAIQDIGLSSSCVFTSEIKKHAIEAYKNNFNDDDIFGDIIPIDPEDIPDFDFLLAGFPCQPFSSAGNRHGFLDERGGLFFKIYEILKSKRPEGFLLENVDGLVTHNGGKTFQTIIDKLVNLGYYVEHSIFDSFDFGVPQRRKRVYIVGSLIAKPVFSLPLVERRTAANFIDYTAPVHKTTFTRLLSSKFSKEYLEGKAIKDKRGGPNNIHSWDLEVKGRVNSKQKVLLSEILKKRRSKKWAKNKGIDWMDGMPLTVEEIRTFCDYTELEDDLNYLTDCGYLKFEYPKKIKIINGLRKRVYKEDSEKGYNIVTGKLSFPISKILDPNDVVPTIVATEAGKIAVSTHEGVRSITINEGLRFSGFPMDYDLSGLDYRLAFDLLGNTVMPPVIKYVSSCLLEARFNASKYPLSNVS